MTSESSAARVSFPAAISARIDVEETSIGAKSRKSMRAFFGKEPSFSGQCGRPAHAKRTILQRLSMSRQADNFPMWSEPIIQTKSAFGYFSARYRAVSIE